MEDATMVRSCEGLRDVDREFQRLLERKCTFAQTVRQCFSLQILHHEVGSPVLRTDVVQVTNVRMIE